MAVYYQARSAEEINRQQLESKCPNIMKGRRTKTQWNMLHFVILKNIDFSHHSLFIYLAAIQWLFQVCLYLWHFCVRATLYPLVLFLVSHYLLKTCSAVLPKQFPPVYIDGERSGLCQRALWSEPVWPLHSDLLPSRKMVSAYVHVCSGLEPHLYKLFS